MIFLRQDRPSPSTCICDKVCNHCIIGGGGGVSSKKPFKLHGIVYNSINHSIKILAVKILEANQIMLPPFNLFDPETPGSNLLNMKPICERAYQNTNTHRWRYLLSAHNSDWYLENKKYPYYIHTPCLWGHFMRWSRFLLSVRTTVFNQVNVFEWHWHAKKIICPFPC